LLIKERRKNMFKHTILGSWRTTIYYTCTEVDEFIAGLQKRDYECVQTDEGVLGCGNYICCPPNNTMWYFIITERYINEWTSGHTIRRCRKLSKSAQALLEEYR
jgi:hypothetical protein